MNKNIEDLIMRYGDMGFFTRVAPSQAMIAEVEEKLGFSVSSQYLDYLKKYSHGGIGFEVFGIGFDGSIMFLEETLEYRNYGLPNNLLVIENCDECLYCIDTKTGQIVSWAPDEDASIEYSCFDDYLEERLNSAIENL